MRDRRDGGVAAASQRGGRWGGAPRRGCALPHLHLNRVALLQRTVQDARGVNHLRPEATNRVIPTARGVGAMRGRDPPQKSGQLAGASVAPVARAPLTAIQRWALQPRRWQPNPGAAAGRLPAAALRAQHAESAAAAHTTRQHAADRRCGNGSPGRRGSTAHLPAQVLVVCVPHVQRLCGEGVGLHLHVGARHCGAGCARRRVGAGAGTGRGAAGPARQPPQGDVVSQLAADMSTPLTLVHEAALAHVGVAAHQQGAGVRVDRRQAAHVLPHLRKRQDRVRAQGGGH